MRLYQNTKHVWEPYLTDSVMYMYNCCTLTRTASPTLCCYQNIWSRCKNLSSEPKIIFWCLNGISEQNIIMNGQLIARDDQNTEQVTDAEQLQSKWIQFGLKTKKECLGTRVYNAFLYSSSALSTRNIFNSARTSMCCWLPWMIRSHKVRHLLRPLRPWPPPCRPTTTRGCCLT